MVYSAGPPIHKRNASKLVLQITNARPTTLVHGQGLETLPKYTTAGTLIDRLMITGRAAVQAPVENQLVTLVGGKEDVLRMSL